MEVNLILWYKLIILKVDKDTLLKTVESKYVNSYDVVCDVSHTTCR